MEAQAVFEMSQMSAAGKNDTQGEAVRELVKFRGISVQNNVFLEQEQEFD